MIAGSLEQGTGGSLQRISDHPHKDLFKPLSSEQGGVIRSMALIKFARQIGRLLEQTIAPWQAELIRWNPAGCPERRKCFRRQFTLSPWIEAKFVLPHALNCATGP